MTSAPYQIFCRTAGAFVLCLATTQSIAAPLSDLRGGQTGRIEFSSITSTSRFALVRRTYDHTPVVVYGELLIPKGVVDKIPAIVLSHGSAGVNPALHSVWAKNMNEWGYAVFIIDSFRPRGLDSLTRNQAALDPTSNEADALNALRLLATHPQIDADKIVNMGFSRGGQVAFDTYFDMFRKGIIDNNLKFAANIPVYMQCNIRYRADRTNTNRAPMLMMLAENDNYTSAKPCIEYAEQLNRESGLNIQVRVYKDAYHGFDGLSQRHTERAQNTNSCKMQVFLTDKPGWGLGVATNLLTGKHIKDFIEWDRTAIACVRTSNVVVAGNALAREAAVSDTHEFLRTVFGR